MPSLSAYCRSYQSLCRSALFLACAIGAPASHALAETGKGITHTVIIEGMQFVPSSLQIKAGDSVNWVNKDPFPHTATSSSKQFDSGSLASGKSWKHRFAKPGDYEYICTLHPTMRARLVVK